MERKKERDTTSSTISPNLEKKSSSFTSSSALHSLLHIHSVREEENIYKLSLLPTTLSGCDLKAIPSMEAHFFNQKTRK